MMLSATAAYVIRAIAVIEIRKEKYHLVRIILMQRVEGAQTLHARDVQSANSMHA